MISIFKRELKGYFITPVAYIIIGLFVLVCSVYYYVGNIRMQTGEIDGLFNSMGIILLFSPTVTFSACTGFVSGVTGAKL